jgi:PAS domain S-box-containing protein
MSVDYLKLFRAFPETSVIISPENYKIIDATDDYLEVTMRAREELIGKNMFEAFPDNPGSNDSNNSALLKKSLDFVIKNKEIHFLDTLRYDIPKPDGTFDYRFWEASHTPVFDENNKLLFIIQKTSDVTEREMTKIALTESEDKFTFMAESMPQLVWIANPAGEATYFNKKWENYTGVSVKKLLGNNWMKVVHPDDIAQLEKRIKEALPGGDDFQVEYRVKRHDGEYRWYLTRALPKKNKAGEITLWVGSGIDIHDQKLMVKELLSSNEKLAELSDKIQDAYERAEMERKTLENLIMEAPAAICILKGPEHRFDLVNPNYQKLFPNRILKNKTILEALPEIKGQGFVELLDNVYNTGETFVGKELPIKLDKNDTGELEDTFFTFTYQPLYEKGKIIGIVVFANEVKELVLAKQKLANLEIEENMDKKTASN